MQSLTRAAAPGEERRRGSKQPPSPQRERPLEKTRAAAPTGAQEAAREESHAGSERSRAAGATRGDRPSRPPRTFHDPLPLAGDRRLDRADAVRRVRGRTALLALVPEPRRPRRAGL